MSKGGGEALQRSFSGIDDGLNFLLADLKHDGGIGVGEEGHVRAHGLTPLVKLESLDAEHLGFPPAAAAAAAGQPGLKAGSSAGAPDLLVRSLPFIPVASAAPPHKQQGGSGGKMRPMQRTGSEGFTIPAAYGSRPLTQLDFIGLDDLDEHAAAAGKATPAVVGSGGSGSFEEFGELADLSRLGDLPTDDDLKVLLFSPVLPHIPTQPPTALGGSSGYAADGGVAGAHVVPVAGLHGLPLGQPVLQQQQPGAYFIPHADPFGQPYGDPSSSGRSFEPLAVFSGNAAAAAAAAVAAAAQPGLPYHRPATVFRIKTTRGAAPGGGSAAAAPGNTGAGGGGLGSRQPSLGSLGSLKRRVDGLEIESEPGSARSSKRSMHSGGSGSVWSDVMKDEEGGSTPRSDPPRTAFSGQHQLLTSSGSGPSRFGQEAGRSRWGGRSGSSSSEDSDPAYVPSREQQSRPRQAPRQQQQQQQYFQQQQQWQAAAAAAEAEPEEPAAAPVQYRGVSRHRLTQRWEASLWLNGRQLYLGGFNSQEDAAHAYDLAALACKGLDAQINFSPADYREQLAEIKGFTRDEVVAYVRRRSSAFSRGKSRFRGVSGHNQRWEARIGSFQGRKNVSFGVFESEEEAARQYDRALILEKGRAAKTNFPMRDYEREVAAYEGVLQAECGTMHGPATHHIAAAYTLPRNREATADEKKRSAVIYAEALRQALWE